MKHKKKLTISILALILLLTASIYAYNRRYNVTVKQDSYSVINFQQEQTPLGEKVNIKDFNGIRTLNGVELTAGESIKITCYSKIASGSFEIAVLDPEYKLLEKINANSDSSINVKAQKNGTYVIRLMGKHAEGYFQINITSDDDINIVHKDITG